ncbi:class IIb bacteriocin, lactobin A/cerein 7B family [Streptococcus plurextorum]|uniref:class IIb bacteriocin, lactobin A/cerein 7B family n=1 Tax=Streptococcus plurextorum TaxID=456876 RepID=UPI0004233361|nr:class IIb bacteriocin, lactobin A/cerein 7B family [Streptococcus plurextorum]
MKHFTQLNSEELVAINGGVVIGIAAATLITTVVGGSFTAGYVFGKDLANGNRRRAGK